MKHIYFIHITCLMLSCYCGYYIAVVTKSKQVQDKVIFIKGQREYGWKEYGNDSTRLSRPLPIILGVYTAEFHLTQSELTIYKVDFAKESETRKAIHTQSLSEEQQHKFRDFISKANIDSIKQISTNPHVADGFDVDVVIKKGNQVENISWSNKYVPELVGLLSIVNGLSPEKFRFFKNEKLFIQDLKKLSALEEKLKRQSH